MQATGSAVKCTALANCAGPTEESTTATCVRTCSTAMACRKHPAPIALTTRATGKMAKCPDTALSSKRSTLFSSLVHLVEWYYATIMYYRYANGDVYEGYFQDNQPHGHGTLKRGHFLTSAADVYVGQWDSGQKHGYGVMDDIVAGSLWLCQQRFSNRITGSIHYFFFDYQIKVHESIQVNYLLLFTARSSLSKHY